MTEKIAIKELQSLEQDSGLVILYELALDAEVQVERILLEVKILI